MFKNKLGEYSVKESVESGGTFFVMAKNGGYNFSCGVFIKHGGCQFKISDNTIQKSS